MKIYRSLDKIEKEKCVLTTGTFDGVHAGHQTIVRRLKETAAKEGSCSTIVTFEPHPQFVVIPGKTPPLKLLTTLDEKISILDKAGIDRLIVIPFNKEFSRLSSQKFIENILINNIGFNKIIIGYDHAFGKGRKGNINILKALQKKHVYSLIQMEPFSIDGNVISSTKIRNLISTGDFNKAINLLGHSYTLSGKVIAGEGRGKSYNVPTANIEPIHKNKLVPQHGIYSGWAIYKKQKIKSIIYIGTKPTFENRLPAIEVHMMDFSANLYGENLGIEFICKIRDDQKFDNPEMLYEQIKLDKQKTLEILNNDFNK